MNANKERQQEPRRRSERPNAVVIWERDGQTEPTVRTMTAGEAGPEGEPAPVIRIVSSGFGRQPAEAAGRTAPQAMLRTAA